MAGPTPTSPELSSSTILTLTQATAECRQDLTNPEKVTAFWRAFIAERGKRASLSLSVPACPANEHQIKEKLRESIRPIYVPEELSTQEKRHFLGQMFPSMQSESIKEGNQVTNTVNHFGWRWFHMAIDAPYLGMGKAELRKIMHDQGYEEATLNEYSLATQASILLTSKYLDQGGTMSLILGSHYHGDPIVADTEINGDIDTYSAFDLSDGHPHTGARFSLAM